MSDPFRRGRSGRLSSSDLIRDRLGSEAKPAIAGGFFEAVTAGAVTLQPSILDNVNQFFDTTVAPGAVSLSAPLLENSQTFYAPTVASGSLTLAPALYSNAQTFFGPTVSSSATILQPGLVTNTSAFYGVTVTPGPITLQPELLSSAGQFFAPAVELQSRVITRAQAQLLRRIHALHGLAATPLVVGPSSRSAGDITQTINQAGQSVTIATTAADDVVLADVGQMIEELAALHGITAPLTVTPTTRIAGTIVQSLATVGSVTTVTRQ